jgi:surface protein
MKTQGHKQFKRFLLIGLFLTSYLGFAQTEFITTWQTTAGESITIPTKNGVTYNYTVDWGDGTIPTIHTGLAINAVDATDATHTYTTTAVHTISISGIFPAICFGDASLVDKPKILSIEQWGIGVWTSMERAFNGCTSLQGNYTDIPDLSSVTNMNYMFENTYVFNGSVTGWNVSNVTTMARTFATSLIFNGDLSAWNVSNVTNMNAMFYRAQKLDQDLSSWNVGKVTNMFDMFQRASLFNADISGWNVGEVTNMGSMFNQAQAFNQNIGSWNVAKVTNMLGMFHKALAFNQNIGGWNVSNVTDMKEMFRQVPLSLANYDLLLNGWNTRTLKDNVTFDALGMEYCAGASARANMISTYNWKISDGGEGCPSITTLFPANNAANIAITTNLVITFDRTMVADTGNIKIYDALDQ